MIVGLGVDVVPVDRFAEALARAPTMAHRLFTDDERVTDSGGARAAESLAARFAAQEALAKGRGGTRGAAGGHRVARLALARRRDRGGDGDRRRVGSTTRP